MTDISAVTNAMAELSLTPEQQQHLLNALKQVVETQQPAQNDELQQRAAANDEARTLAAVLKPARIKPYEGAIDADLCLNFIDNQEEYFNIVNLSQNLWVKYTAVNLDGDAKAWWRNSDLTINSPWKDFRAAFIEYHTPPNAVAAARYELERLKQKLLSVKEYSSRFRRLLRLIPDMDAGTALHIYMNGLEPDTGKEVRLRQPENLAQAVHQAATIHAILYPNGPTKTSTPALATAMDLDAVSVLVAHLTNLVNTNTNPVTNQSTTVANFRRPLGKLTSVERERLRKIGACFRCRRKGHLATDCRVPPSALNNIEAENDDGNSGKDQGEV
ncbi:hypothetical protein BGX28_002981 [Mortierella sp. GBA30]|nr:hypothetical protein BGX28_002981 [Mortierella sp. GBA30]